MEIEDRPFLGELPRRSAEPLTSFSRGTAHVV